MVFEMEWARAGDGSLGKSGGAARRAGLPSVCCRGGGHTTSADNAIAAAEYTQKRGLFMPLIDTDYYDYFACYMLLWVHRHVDVVLAVRECL